MNLRIIKKESSRISTVHPFYFTEGYVENLPESYMLSEAAQVGELSDGPDLSKTAEPPSMPVIDIEQLEKDAFDRGYAQGRQEGLGEGLKAGEESAAARIEEMALQYTDSLAEVMTLKDTLRTQVEEEVVRLALAVAKKIVRREIHADTTIIHTMVRVALERVSGKSSAEIRLNPLDYEYMTRRHGDLPRTEGRDIKFESDNTISQGGCLIQTETGDIDARIEEEFREIESAFFEGL